MPQTRECDYCGGDIEPGTGTMFVSVTGSVAHYCSSKCEKNADLGREPRDLEWTVAGGAGAGARRESRTEEPAEAPPPEASVDASEGEPSGAEAAADEDDGSAEAIEADEGTAADDDAELDGE